MWQKIDQKAVSINYKALFQPGGQLFVRDPRIFLHPAIRQSSSWKFFLKLYYIEDMYASTSSMREVFLKVVAE